MRVSCPACRAEYSLEVALARDADAAAFGALLSAAVPELREVLVAYLALHRPAKQRLSIARAANLAREVLADVQRQAVNRKGRDWSAPPAVWRDAMAHVIEMGRQGKLTLPLSGHGYLHEVLCGMADKAEAAAERQIESDRRGRAHVGDAQPVAQALDAIAAQAVGAARIEPPAERRAEHAQALRQLSSKLRSGTRPPQEPIA